MARRKSKVYPITEKKLTNLQVISFMLHTEADKLRNENPDITPTELTVMTMGGMRVSLAGVLDGLAEWLETFVNTIKIT